MINIEEKIPVRNVLTDGAYNDLPLTEKSTSNTCWRLQAASV
jgi:hypothetical protein